MPEIKNGIGPDHSEKIKPTVNVYPECHGPVGVPSNQVRLTFGSIPHGNVSKWELSCIYGTGFKPPEYQLYSGSNTEFIHNVPAEHNGKSITYTIIGTNITETSDPVTYKFSGCPCTVSPKLPDTPKKPSLVLVDNNTTQLSWAAVSAGDGSIKEYEISDGSKTKTVGNVLQYRASREEWGDTHSFKVRAINTYDATSSYSSYSDEVELPSVPSKPVVRGVQEEEDDRLFAKFTWEKPDSDSPITGYEVEYVVYTRGDDFAWQPSFDGVDSLSSEVGEYRVPIDEIPGRVEFYLRATNSVGVSSQAKSVVNAYGGIPELPNFEGDVYLGPDHVIDHLNKNNSSFSQLLDLSWLEAHDAVEELENNKNNVKPLFAGPDHVEGYDEYMYTTMADQYIDHAAQDVIPEVVKILQEDFVNVFSASSVEFAGKEDIDPPDWIGADNLKEYYDHVGDYWNLSRLPGFIPDLANWYPEYLEWCKNMAFAAYCDAMDNVGYKDFCTVGCNGDGCCEYYAELYLYYVAYIFVILALLPLLLVLCLMFPAECDSVLASSKSTLSKLIKDAGSFVSQASAPFADTVDLFNQDNLESTWIRFANGVLTLEGRDSIDALSLTHAERFFEFLDIDWDGDWSTAVDLVKDHSDVLFTTKGYAAIRYALELPEFIDLDETVKTYYRITKKDSV